MDVKQLEAELEWLRQENRKLRKELEALQKRTVGETQSLSPVSPTPAQVGNRSGATAKIALFRNLFRGREDVYALHWESLTGRTGYSPARTRPRNKTADTEADLLPLTDQVIFDHLAGKQTVGIYSLLKDETCWFLAVDFDKAGWQDDITAFRATCRDFDLTPAIERSRSGKGGHAWFFFQFPVPASLARKMGCALLTATMERRHELGLDSYDRLFPSQDTMPKGGFGNLIALPLQAGPRRQGNSLFLDEHLLPYSDQWAFLSSLQKISPGKVESLVAEAQRTGRVLGIRLSLDEDEVSAKTPWLQTTRPADDLQLDAIPSRVQITVSDSIYLEKEGLPPALLNRLMRLAAFQNPDFYRAQAMRLSTFSKPRIIGCGQDLPHHIALPRGCLEEVVELFQSLKVKVKIDDQRCSGTPIESRFQGELRSQQKQALKALLEHDTGILSAPTAFGKTVVAAAVIAARGVNTLILVHRRQLLDQWRTRLAAFLEEPESIGQIGGGKRQPTGLIDVGMIQSLNKKGKVDPIVTEYGSIIVDECHHISAFSFEQVLRTVKARYVLGLTATPVRKDGHHPIFRMQCGPIRYHVDARAHAARRPFEHLVLPRLTHFRLPESEELSIQRIFARLAADASRNDQIFDDLVAAVDQGRSPLFLTERTDHLMEFAERIQHFCQNVIVLKGGMTDRKRRKLAEQIASLDETEERVILATGRYIGEGYDDPRLDTLFLAMPISWKGTLQQYVGRLHRLHANKREVQVYDYIDAAVPVLQRMHDRRCRGYHSLGYRISKPFETQDRGLPALSGRSSK